MRRLLIICGPTATGKTGLGVKLAKKFNGEIVSADSRQVYRYMNIGTGKDVPVNSKLQIPNSKQFQISNFKFQIGYYEIERIPLWLLDIVNPDYRFNVADYKRCTVVVIKDIQERGKLPIIVGGTGFYIKAITEEIETIGVEPNLELRSKLSNYPIGKLRITLEKLDQEKWEKMNESDRKNPRRLIRAIEIARKCKIQSSKCKVTIQSSKLDTLFVGLKSSYEMLYRRIDRRVEERVKAGIEDEIRGLLEKGYNWENSALGTTLAYREWKDYFEGEATKEEVARKWKFDEHNYARRQMTWFKKDPKIVWFDLAKDNWQEEVEKMVESWYS